VAQLEKAFADYRDGYVKRNDASRDRISV